MGVVSARLLLRCAAAAAGCFACCRCGWKGSINQLVYECVGWLVGWSFGRLHPSSICSSSLGGTQAWKRIGRFQKREPTRGRRKKTPVPRFGPHARRAQCPHVLIPKSCLLVVGYWAGVWSKGARMRCAGGLFDVQQEEWFVAAGLAAAPASLAADRRPTNLPTGPAARNPQTTAAANLYGSKVRVNRAHESGCHQTQPDVKPAAKQAYRCASLLAPSRPIAHARRNRAQKADGPGVRMYAQARVWGLVCGLISLLLSFFGHTVKHSRQSTQPIN